MTTNNFKFNRIKTLGIEPKNEEKVIIKIPLEKGCFWEKEYFQNDLIGNVINDFKEENNVDIPKDYFMDWNCKNKSLKMTDKIKTLLVQEVPTIFFNPEMKKKPLIIQENDIIPQVIGKPFNNPFEIFLFKKADKNLKIQTFNKNIINNLGLNDYSPSSAYCNGNNQLFISGGETKNNKIINKFWQIDLGDNNFLNNPLIIPPKKNHSMIFIPPQYVFVIGGNDKKTFYFDSEKQEIYEWADLKKLRFEPSLQRVGNSLYCFDNINKINNEQLSFEKTDLNKNNPEWNLIYPKMDLSIQKLPQKFFGVSKDADNSIMFLGGTMDKYSEENKLLNYKYNPNTNIIEPSNVPYHEYNFKEKTFLPYNRNIDFILPDFNRQCPEVVFYVRNKSKIQKVDYKPNINKKSEKTLRSAKRSLLDYKYDFNMPTIKVPDPSPELFTNKNNNNRIKDKQKSINPFNLNDLNEPFFQENDYNLNLEIKQPPPFKEPEIQVTNGDQRISIEIPNNFTQSKKENENNFDVNEEKKNINEKDEDLIKLKLIPRPPKVQKNKEKYSKEYIIPRFHYSVNDPGNELNITRKGKIYSNYIPTEPSRNKARQADFNLKYSSLEKEDLILPNYNYSIETEKENSSMGKYTKNSRYNKLNRDLNDNFTTPNIHIPQSPSANLKSINLNSPGFKIDGNTPEIKVIGKTINTSPGNRIITGQNTNFEMNGVIQGTKSPRHFVKDPELNSSNYKINENIQNFNPSKFEIKSPNINLKGPKINSKDIKVPDYNLNGNITESDNKIPNKDIPSEDIKLKGIKITGSDYNLEGNIPCIKINAPKAEIPLGKINLKNSKNSPDFNLSGIIPGQKLKRTASNSGLKVSKNIPSYNMTSDLPSGNYKSSRLHMNSPDLNIRGNRKISDYKTNINTNIKGVIPGINMKSPKKNNPDLKISGNIPDFNFNSPKINLQSESGKIRNLELDGSIHELKGDIPNFKNNSPKIGINSPNLNLEEKEYNLNRNIPGVSINSQEIELNGPKVDLNRPKDQFFLQGIIQGSKLYKSNLNIKSPNINSKEKNINNPNYNLSGNIQSENIKEIKVNSPNINLNLPNKEGQDYSLKGDIPGIKINIPKVDIKSPNENLKGPEYNLNGNLQEVNIKKPKIDIPSGKINLESPNIKTGYNLAGNIPGKNKKNQNFFLSGIIPSYRNRSPDLEIRNYKITEPNIKITTMEPNFNIKGSNNKSSRGGSQGKRNFHGSVNDPNYPENYELKGSRRPLFSQKFEDIELSKKIEKNKLDICSNKIIDEKDVILQEPFNNQYFFKK